MGSPFVHAGRNEHGYDCAGVILVPAQHLGLTTWKPTNYSPTGFAGYLQQCLPLHCHRLLDYEHRHPGDILIIYTRGHPVHLAYLTGENTIIHADLRVGRVLEEPFSDQWQKRVHSAWRWKGLEE